MGLLQPHTEGAHGQQTRSEAGSGFKYGKRGVEQGIRGQWEQGQWCRGGVRDWGNQGGNRSGTMQQTGANGDQGKGEHSREGPYKGRRASGENRTGVQ